MLLKAADRKRYVAPVVLTSEQETKRQANLDRLRQSRMAKSPA